MLDRLVAQIALDGSGIDTVIRQFVAAGRINSRWSSCRRLQNLKIFYKRKGRFEELYDSLCFTFLS
jgi:type IV secretory pathway protease TraF